MESLIGTCLPALCGESSKKVQWPLPALLSEGKLSLSFHADPSHFSSSPMPLVPVKMLPQCWISEGVIWVSLCMGPLRGTAWNSRSFLSSITSIPMGFYSQKFWRLIFLVLEPWAGGPGMDPHSEDIPPNFHLSHMGIGPPYSLCPSYQFWCGFFFNSVVVGLPFILISGSIE